MSTHESFIYNLTKIDIMLECDKNKNIPKNNKLFLRIIVLKAGLEPARTLLLIGF